MRLVSRRSFLRGSVAMLTTLGWDGCVSAPRPGETLAAWCPGELDLHFIYTGCGENLFYRLPDGTAILNDVGDYYRPRELADVPLLPNPTRLGGDWVCRYLKRVYPEDVIDYAVFSHLHADHVGHNRFDVSIRPEEHFRYRTTSAGERINGFRCVTEAFRIRQIFSNQHPNYGQYDGAGDCRALLADWVLRERSRGLVAEPFAVGALDQIALRRDPARYCGVFSIRNVTANGVVWDGRDGAIDLAAEHMKTPGAQRLNQNDLSLSFMMRYGKFSYYASGDIQTMTYRRADGSVVDVETAIGQALGPLTVCKMGHLGCRNAMNEPFVRAVRADAYISAMWCPFQAHPGTLARLFRYKSATGRKPLILPQLMAPRQKNWFADADLTPPHDAAVHIVVRVAPGGESYRVFLLDARDEEMRVVAKFDRTC